MSPSGTQTWDGQCTSSSVCTQSSPCAFAASPQISSVEGSICTLHLASGNYGNTIISLSFAPSTSSELVITSSDSSKASISLHLDAGSHALAIEQLYIQSPDLQFKSTNTTSMVIENSQFELLASNDATSIGFARSNVDTLSTLVRNSTFFSTSTSLYYLTSFSNQDLSLESVRFEGSAVAILGGSNSLSAVDSTFRTPSLYQGEVAQVFISNCSLPTIRQSLLRATTSLTNLTILASSFASDSGNYDPDQLLSDPSFNLISSINIRNSSFGAQFTLGPLILHSNATLDILGSSFADTAGSFDLTRGAKVSIIGNNFTRAYDAPMLSLISTSLDASHEPIAIFDNSFADSDSLKTASISLTNLSSFDAETSVDINTLQVLGNVTINGLWLIRKSIIGSSIPTTIDYLVSSTVSPTTVSLNTIFVTNVSLDFSDISALSYTTTNASGILGPQKELGYYIYLPSSSLSLYWDEKSVGFLPSLGTSYNFSSSLFSAPMSTGWVSLGRFNYSIVQGTSSHAASIVYGVVDCPSQCDPENSLPACVATDKCSCSSGFGGSFCKCNTSGLPASAQCSDNGSAEWYFESSAVIASLNLPSRHSLVSDGNLQITGPVSLKSGSNVTVGGALTFGGSVQILSRVLTSTDGSSCNAYTDVHVESHGLVLNSTARFNITLDLSSLDVNSVCRTASLANFATFKSLNSASDLSPYASWTVNFTSPSNNSKRADMEALASQLEFTVRLVDSASATNLANPRVTTNAPAGSCASSSTGSPGTIDVVVQPCPPASPNANPSSGSRGSKVLWWYWGIPVIVVGAILIIVLIVLLAVRPCCRK